MKKIFSILISILFLSSHAYADETSIKYDLFRQNVLHLFKIPKNQKIVFERFEGQSYSQNSVKDCEIQFKSTATSTTLDIIFPTSNQAQVQIEFSSNREILEQIGVYQLKYSSYQTACSGDQYDTYRDCWEYDQSEIVLEKEHDDLSNVLTVILRGQNCSIKI